MITTFCLGDHEKTLLLEIKQASYFFEKFDFFVGKIIKNLIFLKTWKFKRNCANNPMRFTPTATKHLRSFDSQNHQLLHISDTQRPQPGTIRTRNDQALADFGHTVTTLRHISETTYYRILHLSNSTRQTSGVVQNQNDKHLGTCWGHQRPTWSRLV